MLCFRLSCGCRRLAREQALIDDMLAESDETLYLSLANATGASLGTYLWGNGKVLAND